MKTTKAGRMAILSTIIAVGLAAITAVHVYYIRDVQRESREALQHSTAILADRLNGRIREMIHTVEGLGAFLTATPSLPNPDAFDHYARQAVLTHATLRALQFVNTNGVIEQVFPVEGNESVLGIDLTPLADWAYLEEARRSQRTFVDPKPGPLVQGPLGSIIRTPLYRKDAFLGWAQGVYGVENLMHGTESELNPRQLMQLVNSEGEVLLGSTVIPDTTISVPIESGGSMWQLRVAWANPERRVSSVPLALIWGGGLCLIAAALSILRVGWRKEDELSLAVRWRTAQIEENERKLSAAMRVARLSYWEDDFENRVSWSEEGCRILGVPLDEHSWTWDSFMELVYPDDRRLLNESRKIVMQGKSNYQISFRVVHPDGEVQYFEAVGEPVLGETGQPIRMVGAVQDVSERKRAEEALRESEEKYRVLYETMLHGVIYHDSQGRIISANPAAEKILGLNTEDITQRATIDSRWQVLYEDGSEFPAEYRPSRVALKTGTSQKDVIMGVFNPKENQYRWIIVNAVPLFKAEEQHPFMVHTMFIDITEIKENEERLQRYSNRLKVLRQIDKAILSAQPSEEIVQNTLHEFRNLIPCTRSSIVAFDLKKETAWVVSADVDNDTRLEAGTQVALDMFGNMEEFALGKIKFNQDIKTVSFLSPKLLQLKDEGIRSYINIPMICQGKLLGSFNLGSDALDFFTDQYVKIACEVADSLAVAMQHAHLMDEIINHQEKLKRLSAHIIIAQETERKKISMELHDEMGQALTAITINLSSIEKKISSKISPLEKEIVMDTILLAEQTVDQVHDLSLFLRPAILDDLGLVPALRWFIERYAGRSKFEIEFKTIGLDERLEEPIEITIYRIIQEALNNIAKHADATKVMVRLEKKHEMIYGIIKDNGMGFDLDEVLADDGREYGIGLIGMRERLAMINAEFNIESCKGHGTQITMEIPSFGKNIYEKN